MALFRTSCVRPPSLGYRKNPAYASRLDALPPGGFMRRANSSVAVLMAICLAVAICAFPIGPAALAAENSSADVVRLTPIPALSLAVPKGWVTCNPDDNALLGGLPDTAQGCA